MWNYLGEPAFQYIYIHTPGSYNTLTEIDTLPSEQYYE